MAASIATAKNAYLMLDAIQIPPVVDFARRP
jgi:hypothetical protein